MGTEGFQAGPAANASVGHTPATMSTQRPRSRSIEDRLRRLFSARMFVAAVLQFLNNRALK